MSALPFQFGRVTSVPPAGGSVVGSVIDWFRSLGRDEAAEAEQLRLFILGQERWRRLYDFFALMSQERVRRTIVLTPSEEAAYWELGKLVAEYERVEPELVNALRRAHEAAVRDGRLSPNAIRYGTPPQGLGELVTLLIVTVAGTIAAVTSILGVAALYMRKEEAVEVARINAERQKGDRLLAPLIDSANRSVAAGQPIDPRLLDTIARLGGSISAGGSVGGQVASAGIGIGAVLLGIAALWLISKQSPRGSRRLLGV